VSTPPVDDTLLRDGRREALNAGKCLVERVGKGGGCAPSGLSRFFFLPEQRVGGLFAGIVLAGPNLSRLPALALVGTS
jgi:hypothetical protein